RRRRRSSKPFADSRDAFAVQVPRPGTIWLLPAFLCELDRIGQPEMIVTTDTVSPTRPKASKHSAWRVLRLLGPGLVTGAADDDPSGIATYSQAGAQFGYGLLWTVFLTTPFMIAIQLVSARIGRVTGKGL